MCSLPCNVNVGFKTENFLNASEMKIVETQNGWGWKKA